MRSTVLPFCSNSLSSVFGEAVIVDELVFSDSAIGDMVEFINEHLIREGGYERVDDSSQALNVLGMGKSPVLDVPIVHSAGKGNAAREGNLFHDGVAACLDNVSSKELEAAYGEVWEIEERSVIGGPVSTEAYCTGMRPIYYSYTECLVRDLGLDVEVDQSLAGGETVGVVLLEVQTLKEGLFSENVIREACTTNPGMQYLGMESPTSGATGSSSKTDCVSVSSKGIPKGMKGCVHGGVISRSARLSRLPDSSAPTGTSRSGADGCWHVAAVEGFAFGGSMELTLEMS